MPEGHEIPAFEQTRRGPGRPRKEAEAMQTPAPVISEESIVEAMAPIAEVKPIGPRMVRIVIHSSEDGKDNGMVEMPEPGTMGERWLRLPRSQEIVVDERVYKHLLPICRVVDETALLNDAGKPVGKKSRSYKSFPMTFLGYADD